MKNVLQLKFAEMLRVQMKCRKLSLRQFAKLVGKDPASVGHVVRAQRNVSLRTVLEYAIALDMIPTLNWRRKKQ